MQSGDSFAQTPEAGEFAPMGHVYHIGSAPLTCHKAVIDVVNKLSCTKAQPSYRITDDAVSSSIHRR